jgi:hypothetical protein
MARWKQGDWALSMDPRQNTGLSPCHMGGVQHHLEASEGRVPSSWCPPKRAQAWAFGFCHRNTLGVFRVCFTFGGRESCRKVISRYAYIYNCTWHWSLGLCVCPSNFPKALSDVYCHKRKLEAFLLSWFSESFWIIWNYLFREGLNNSLKKLGVPLSISHNLFSISGINFDNLSFSRNPHQALIFARICVECCTTSFVFTSGSFLPVALSPVTLLILCVCFVFPD